MNPLRIAFSIGLLTTQAVVQGTSTRGEIPNHDIFQRFKTDAPSLQLQITLLNESDAIHGQSIFDAFANPVISADGSSVRYDGHATFIEDENKYTYVLVNGVGYAVHSTGNTTTSAATQDVSCLPPLISYSSIVSALNTAMASTDALSDCNGDTIFENLLKGEDFHICASEMSGFVAYGGNMLVRVEYLDSPLAKISAPKLTKTMDECAGTSAAMPLTVSTLKPFTRDSITTPAMIRGL